MQILLLLFIICNLKIIQTMDIATTLYPILILSYMAAAIYDDININYKSVAIWSVCIILRLQITNSNSNNCMTCNMHYYHINLSYNCLNI